MIKKARAWKKNLPFHLMLLPALILVLIYRYGSMFGLVMAFQKFNPVLGFFKSPWVGWKNFIYIFSMPEFYRVLRNTLYISLGRICFGILVPLILALLINEVRVRFFKRFVQSTLFVPYFLSWAILGGIIIEIFSLKGPVNSILSLLGMEPIFFLANNRWFPPLLVSTGVWRSQGYNMIIFLAAISNIDPHLYEAAEVDGANRWQQAVHITLPGMFPILMLLSAVYIGQVLNTNSELFQQVLVLYNPIVYKSGDIIDTFVYRLGIFSGQFSPAAAVGLFKSLICSVIFFTFYILAYKVSNYRIF